MSNENGDYIIDAVATRLYTPEGVRVYIGWTCHRLSGHNESRNSWMTACGEAFGPAGRFRETLDPLTCVICMAARLAR